MTLKHVLFIILIQFFTLSIAYSNEKQPFFDGTTLNIPIVNAPGQSGAYQSVKFKQLTDNKWQLLDYKRRVPMLGILKVELLLTEEQPIQGFLKVTWGGGACTKISSIRHELIGNTIEVFIDTIETSPDCTRQYVTSKDIIPLPLYKLKSGEYKYTVNGGFEGVFSLSSDNYLADDN